MNDLAHRLARTCARGWRQESLVNEMLVRPIVRDRFIVPNGSGNISLVYGQTRLPNSSFANLRKRLTGVGFVISTVKVDHEHALVSLTFPEQQKDHR